MMSDSYKHCVVLPCEGSAEALRDSLNSVVNVDNFDEVLLLLIINKKIYELDVELFALIDSFEYSNILVLDGINSDEIAPVVSVAVREHGCEDVTFLDEGDTIDPYLLMYTGYFFEDEDNRENCKILFFSNTDDNNLVVDLDIPQDGIADCNKFGLPRNFKCPVIYVSSFEENVVISKLLVLKTLMQQEHYGFITSACYHSPSNKSGYDASVLNEVVGFAKDLYGTIPNYLAKTITLYFKSQLAIPLEEADENLLLLLEYVPNIQELINELYETDLGTEKIAPFVEIDTVQNYYLDVEISGTAYLSGSDDIFDVSSDTAIASFICDENSATYADIIRPKRPFTLKTSINNPIVHVNFTKNGENIPIVLNNDTWRNYEVTVENDVLNIEKIAPRAYYKVSVIIPIYNGEKYLRDAFNSVLEQTLDFFPNTQIVLINDGSTDDTAVICREFAEKYIYNVTYREILHSGVSAARNAGLRCSMGKYVFFLDSDDEIEDNLLETGINYLEKNIDVNVAAFPIKYAGADIATPVLNFRFETNPHIVDIEDKYNYIQFSASGVLLRAEAVDGIVFDEQLSYSEDAEFMHRVLLSCNKYALIGNAYYIYRVEKTDISAMRSRTANSAWYNKFNVFHKLLIEYSNITLGKISRYTQYLIAHELISAITSDEPPSDIDISEINDNIRSALQFVDDDIIIDANTLPYELRLHLLFLKYNINARDSFQISDAGLLQIANYTTEYKTSLCIKYIRERNTSIYITGSFVLPLTKDVSLTVSNGSNIQKASIYLNEAHSIKVFGMPINGAWDFEISVDNPGEYLKFYFTIDDKSIPSRVDMLDMKFFAGRNYIITLSETSNMLKIDDYTIDDVEKLFKSHYNKNTPPIFTEYQRMHPFFSKSRIWLFMDEPDSTGLCADFMEYCIENDKSIEKYYVINKDTIGGYELSERGVSIVEYGSEMHKLLLLFAENIIVSSLKYIKEIDTITELNNSNIVLIPNDEINQSEAQTLENMRFPVKIAVSSERVLDKFPEIIRTQAMLTGLPKYDSLTDRRERKILFMPSLRDSLYADGESYNFGFAETDYCQRVNDLLCDERLMNAIEDNGYTFCFAPHEKTYLQIAEFDMDEIVEIIPPSYSRIDLAQECDLLITDCMPEYCFTYLRKPVVYYAFAEEKPFDVPFFGKHITELDDLVDTLIEYIENDCKPGEDYLEKVNGFFVTLNGDSSERILNELK